MEGLAAWIMATSAHSEALNQSGWLIPAVQSVHILAIALVFGSGLVIALRLVGVTGMDWSPARWGQRLSGWIALGLGILLLSGMILVVGEPERALLNANFQIKMLLVLVAAVLSWLMARRLARLDRAPPLGIDKVLTILLVALWLAIIAAGRWIGYS